MVAILATVNEADNVTLVRAEGGVLPVFPLPITAAGVVSVGATAPITSTGGATPVIGINPAVAGVSAGSLSAADKAKLDGIAPGAAVASVSGSNGIASSGGTTPNITWAGLGDIGATGLVDAISGPSPIPITPATLQWTQGTVAPTLTQAQQANAAAPQPLAITPQAPGAGATNATNGTSAPVVITLAVPVNSGAEGFLEVVRASGGSSYVVGPLGALPVVTCVWNGVTPSSTNYNLAYFPTLGITNYSVNSIGGSAEHQFFADTTTGLFFTGKTTVNGQGTNLTSNNSGFGAGVGVAAFSHATTEPGAPGAGAKTLFWGFTDGAFKWRNNQGWRGNLAAFGTGTLNTQAPNVDTFSSAVRTVSTATPTAFTAYTTASNTIGWINVRLKSKAATTASGITTGDGAFAEYRLGYKNVAGTVTLSTAGITLLGSVQTTNAGLTSTLTAAAAGATVVFSVTNVATNTVDSLIDCTIDVC